MLACHRSDLEPPQLAALEQLTDLPVDTASHFTDRMVYFKCIVCSATWTKLLGDGCNECDSPCQVLGEAIPTIDAQAVERADLRRMDLPPVARQRKGYGLMPISEDEEVPLLKDPNQYPLPSTSGSRLGDGIVPEGDNWFRSDLEREVVARNLRDLATPQTAVQTKGEDDNSKDDVAAPCQISNPGREHLPFRSLLSSAFQNQLLMAERSQSQLQSHGDETTQQQVITESCQSVSSDTSPSKPTSIEKIFSVLAKPIDKQVSSPIPRTKKKARKSRNQRRNNPPTTVVKTMPELPLPDPIPSLEAKAVPNSWNEVLRKGSTKAAKRVQNAALDKVKEREFVNASTFLARKDENQLPEPERATMTVRFGMGGAKHQVKRVVPRSALE